MVAEAVAGWAFGSNGAFVTAARNWLTASGLTQTTIVEPTGIDARNTSTPTDLIALARIAQANPVIAQIVAMPATDIPNFDSMLNTNDILGTGGVDGLKTGTLEGSGSNLLFTAKLPVGLDQPVSVIGVVLGGYSHESVNLDVVTMLQSIANGFHDVPLGTAGQTVGTYTTPWGESADMVLDDSASIYTWSDTPITATMETTTLTTGAAMVLSRTSGTVTVFGPAVQVTLPTTVPSWYVGGVSMSIVTMIGVSDQVKIDACSPITICADDPHEVTNEPTS